MLYVDTKTWLPDDLLIKADKMTMATSLELRVPFLDHKVLEFAASLPPHFKLRGREGKRVLKHAFRDRVPAAILERKKAGFPVPYGRWLTTSLREFVHDTVLSSRATSRGYFRRDAVAAVLAGPDSDTRAREIFSLLVLELWHQQFGDCAAVSSVA
jgi:asparagine synthase (glutamine-hydrolysing)